ncbi:TIR domain-containing protein [Desulfococcaceae bacterium HSG9]|nr:TIR domain-containing protein [Desulfococcaceae bacterium HSG9]
MTTSQKLHLIFICYAKEDIEAVKELHKKLKQAGFNPWLDQIDILGGQNQNFVIRQTMKSTDFALICLSQASVRKRGYLNKEIKWALDRQDEMLEGDIFLIPVKLEECDLPDRISVFQYVDLFASDGFERLARAMKHQSGQAIDSDSEIIMPSGPNPFYYGGAVPTQLFCGRKEVLQAITARIGGPALQSVSIVGERRMGKSSLLVYVKNELVKRLPQNHNYLIIYIDLMKGFCHTRKGLMHALRRELTKAWREPWSKDGDGDLEVFDFAVEDLQDENIRLILCLDEVENLTKRPGEFDDLLEDLRANGQMGQIGMITASAQPLADLCNEHKLSSPFFNIFSQNWLGLLKADEWKSLVKNNMPVNQDDLLFIAEMVGGHPLFTQIAAFHLWEIKAKGAVDYDHLKSLLKQEITPHLKYLWQKLSSCEKMALRYYTGKSVGVPPRIILNQLSRRGILGKNQLFCQLFTELINEGVK